MDIYNIYMYIRNDIDNNCFNNYFTHMFTLVQDEEDEDRRVLKRFLYIESSKKFLRDGPDALEEYDNLSDLLVQEDIYGETNNEIVNEIKDRLDRI